MGYRHWVTGLIGVLLLSLSLWQIQAATQGITITALPGSYPPITILSPQAQPTARRPAILVGHGFAGSSVIMRGFGLTLAHAGYTTVVWDFAGHGRNPQPMAQLQGSHSLVEDVQMALEHIQAIGLADPGRVAILGHSMGSGVALDFGVQRPETAATIAVSPVPQPVSDQLPHNLLLLAGELEPRFLENAHDLLRQAGGPGGDPATGSARKLIAIPGVEHISILFSPAAHRASVAWLDATFGAQPRGALYSDRRMAWYLVGILGVLLTSWAIAPIVTRRKTSAEQSLDAEPMSPLWRRLVALLVGVIAASVILGIASAAGLQMTGALNLLIGGFLLIWFAIAGLISILLLRTRLSIPSRQDWVTSLLVFAVLWLGVGLLSQMVWLQWLLIPKRLLLWLPGSLLLLPWFLAVGKAAHRANGLARAGWWLVHSALLLAGLLLALRLNPQLGFLTLILPLLPVVLGLHALAVAPYRRSWPFALSGALFLSWTILAIFPLV